MTVGLATHRPQVLENAVGPADSSPMRWRRAAAASSLATALVLSGLAGRGASQGLVRPIGPGVTRNPPRPDTAWNAYDPPEPTAHYGSYRAAADSLRALVKRALGRWADSAAWQRTREPFHFVLHHGVRLVQPKRGDPFWDLEDADSTIVGPCLRMSYSFQDTGAPVYEQIDDRLRSAGWVIDDRYDADGPDGSRLVLLCREAMVEIDASWEGGDESDSTYVPAPGQSITLRCVPRPRERRFPSHVP